MRSVRFGVFGVLLVGLAVRPAGAATCAGDCSGSGMVQINDLTTCVSIALGTQPASVCSACDVDMNGTVSVNELIDAVNATLYGCAGVPTATPGGATPTPVEPSMTPTFTPTAAASVSMWSVANYAVASSNCPAMFNNGAVNGLRGLGSNVTVRKSAGSVQFDFGGGKVFDGTVDPDGTLTVQTASLGSIGGQCDYELDDDATVNLNTSPTTATYDETVKLSGTCTGLADCSLEITAQWTRLEPHDVSR